MSYQVLARKWRPKNFEQVVGQEHVIRVLSNALTQNRLHHAYLFAGTRGVGKTTIARILAKCLNCETGITATPCEKCTACSAIDAGSFLDLIEVDAASRTRVEDTRDLLDNVQYLPAQGRFKIYIIDEVHMLSGHSFNALLKTLEEPPQHVKFLLATTDPQKLPITVLSRCLQFNLKALNPELTNKQLQHILQQENITYEEPAIYNLALAADGSVRDALSLLDQAIAFGQNKIITTDVNAMLGILDSNKLSELLAALVSNNAKSILTTIQQLAASAVDFTSVINALLETLQQIAIVQLVPDTNTTYWQNQALIHKLAPQLNPEEVQLYYQIALLGKRDLPLAPSPRLGFEMLMLRMLAFRPDKPPTIPQPGKPTTNTMAQNPEILQQLNVTGPTQALLRHCTIAKITEQVVELLLEPNQAPMLHKKHTERITQAFTEYLQRPVTVNITLGTSDIDTLANITKREDAKKQAQALQSVEKDSKIQELIGKFAAKIIATPVEYSNN